MTKYYLVTLGFLLVTVDITAQKPDFERLSEIPKDTAISIPLDYKISRPRPELNNWDIDYDAYKKFHTAAIRKTQAYYSYTVKGVVTIVTPNSIIPHAQLDTATVLKNSEALIGTWRMIKFRSVSFNDSFSLQTKTYYRLSDLLLADKSADEAFAVITEGDFKIYAKEAGKSKFKKMLSAQYVIENNKFMIMYKLVKSGGGVSQIGIDEKGYLIINYPKVIEHVKKDEYISYYTIIDQYIYEKVKQL
jgi:hypothetical protein